MYYKPLDELMAMFDALVKAKPDWCNLEVNQDGFHASMTITEEDLMNYANEFNLYPLVAAGIFLHDPVKRTIYCQFELPRGIER